MRHVQMQRRRSCRRHLTKRCRVPHRSPIAESGDPNGEFCIKGVRANHSYRHVYCADDPSEVIGSAGDGPTCGLRDFPFG